MKKATVCAIGISSVLVLTSGCALIGNKVEPCAGSDYLSPPSSLYAPPSRCSDPALSAPTDYCRVAKGLRQIDDTEYHMLVLEPNNLPKFSPPPNLLLLSFEKPRSRGSSDWKLDPYGFGGSDDARLNILFDRESYDLNDLRKDVNNPRLQILTQAALIGIQGSQADLCFAYSVYGLPAGLEQGACDGHKVQAAKNGKDAVESAVKFLRDQQPALIERLIKELNPTHVLVMSTGWNTSQGESIFNYGEWYRSIKGAAPKDDFRPLIVGISWQSTWDDFPLGSSISALNKGNDADELGIGWVNFVIQTVVKSASAAGSPTILIGHSYGTRVLGHSVFLPKVAENSSASHPDAFVALAGAVPIGRFSADGKEPYWQGDSKTRVLLTSSIHDVATTSVPILKYVGGAGALKEVSSGEHPRIIGAIGGKDGRVNRIPESGEIVLVDASASVSCEKPGTGGGAHSDVFDATAGALIWQIIESVSRSE